MSTNEKELDQIVQQSNSMTLPKYDERAIFIGGTGSGKTNLAMEMASHYNKVIYIDTQNNLKPKHAYTLLTTLNEFYWLWAFKQDKHILYRPKREHRNKHSFNKLFKMLSSWGKPKNKKTDLYPNPFLIYIDDAYALGHGIHNFPDMTIEIATQDRQKGIGLWVACQRPVNIPVPLRTECAYYYIFYLSYDDDIDEISKYGRPKKALKELIQNDLILDHSFIEIVRRTATFTHRKPIKTKN